MRFLSVTVQVLNLLMITVGAETVGPINHAVLVAGIVNEREARVVHYLV